MDLGISTASYFTKLNTEDAFSQIKAAKVDVCEVFLNSFSEYTGVIADSIVSACDVKVHSVHALTSQFEPELFSLSPRSAADAEHVLQGFLETASKLGAKYYTFHGQSRLKNKPYNHDYERLGMIVNRLCDISSDFGLKLSYENVHWAFFKDPIYFYELSKKCPNLMATLDIKQAMQAGIEYNEYLKVCGQRLSTVHVSDIGENREFLLPGRGKFDFVTLFKKLQDIEFDGAVIMEVYAESYNAFVEVAESYEYLKDCYYRAIR